MHDDISETLASGGSMETGAKKTLLRYMVSKVMFCPLTNEVLDVSRAVLIDGSDDKEHGGRMDVMSVTAYEHLLALAGGIDGIRETLPYSFEILDGRELFGT